MQVEAQAQAQAQVRTLLLVQENGKVEGAGKAELKAS